MESLHTRVESWIRDQSGKIRVSWQQLRWPWNRDREQMKKLQEEYERRRKQLQDLCRTIKADSVPDLQDVLCSMVLSECVYKRPATEMLRVVNKFKADFGGQIVSLERVQLSLDHVPHRYLLAEAGDTLYASFIGTKQYKDVIADANILQGEIFHEDCTEDIEQKEVVESHAIDSQNKNSDKPPKSLQSKPNQQRNKWKPAAHRGFLARAKGIPALELYRLAQKKNRKLVLCGHSLGGAVAVLATLAILRVIASSSSKEKEKVMVKCITFSQPPVGNAALRDYVHKKGWHHYFKSYCIPEDLVPRILSPAYFHHYNAQPLQFFSDIDIRQKEGAETTRGIKPKENDEEPQLVLGVGPVQNSFWRLSKLVPLEGVRKQFDKLKGRKNQPGEETSAVAADFGPTSTLEEVEAVPQSLEIQEGSDGISLTPLPDLDKGTDDINGSLLGVKNGTKSGNSGRWRRMPYLPSYVPFGQLFLLGNSSIESLSDSEYSKLTSVRSVITELRERFQSHSMKSYRARFQKIYDMCMSVNASPFLGIEQLPQFTHLQHWLGLAVAGNVELGHIVEAPVIRTATSILPLGWNGVSGGKNAGPLKVDITGYGLHLCTLVQAQVNGNWCSTVVESLPSTPSYSSNHGTQSDLQKMRVLIGAPLRRPPQHQIVADYARPIFHSPDSQSISPNKNSNTSSSGDETIHTAGLTNFVVSCTSDFVSVTKEVYVRTRRVRLVGLEGAGKTSLYNAILGQGRFAASFNSECVHPEVGEGMAGGLCYLDSAGVNLQNLHLEATRFRDELWKGIRDLQWKTDLVILVHNLSHKIPIYHQLNASEQHPALSLLLNEVKSLGIPWVLALTNKFSVSAHLQKSAVSAVIRAYRASPSMTEVVNSCPYVIPNSIGISESWRQPEERDSKGQMGVQRFLLAPIRLVRMPFQKREVVLSVEGVSALCQLVHRVLQSQEETSFQELIEERLSLELAREQTARAADGGRDSKGKANSTTAAAVGASLGAGIGLVLAVVMGAASALRKP